MAFQLSPGVVVKEIDLTNVIPAVSSSIGAMVGSFSQGPVEEIVSVSSETEFVNIFGKPTISNYTAYFQAASFLQYGRTLRVVRASSGQLNAASISAKLISSVDAWENKITEADKTAAGYWAARVPGVYGNSLSVGICTASTDNVAFYGEFDGTNTIADPWDHASEFAQPPTTSPYAEKRGGANDEIHIVVVDTDGKISGEAGTVLEKFAHLSVAEDAKTTDGSTNYWYDVVGRESKYIYPMTNIISDMVEADPIEYAEDPGFLAEVKFANIAGAPLYYNSEDQVLTGGSDGDATVGSDDIVNAMELFADTELVDINLLICPVDDDEDDEKTFATKAIQIAEARKDCIAFISPPVGKTVGASTPTEDVIAYFSTLASTSYAMSDSTAVKMYDKYNDVYRWVPANGHVAGLCAYTDSAADAWWSPAGFNRGQLLGVSKIAFNPTGSQRDDLYQNRVNPIASFPGEGTILYGDKTMLARPSAFDRINVRRLFILLEKAIATAAKYQLFEFNDEFTRAQFKNMVEPFLRDVKGRRGVTDFLVVCDETNNTGQVIDTNNFVADIYIKPARSINFITLNFIATRTDVEFSEIVGQ